MCFMLDIYLLVCCLFTLFISMWNKRRSLNWYFSSHASELNGPSSELYWPNFIISSHEICNFTSYSSTSAVDVVLTFAMSGKIYKSLLLPSQSTTDPTTCHAGSSEPRKISRRDSLGGSKKVGSSLALSAVSCQQGKLFNLLCQRSGKIVTSRTIILLGGPVQGWITSVMQREGPGRQQPN